jgi:hypothetical protein
MVPRTEHSVDYLRLCMVEALATNADFVHSAEHLVSLGHTRSLGLGAVNNEHPVRHGRHVSWFGVAPQHHCKRQIFIGCMLCKVRNTDVSEKPHTVAVYRTYLAALAVRVRYLQYLELLTELNQMQKINIERARGK